MSDTQGTTDQWQEQMYGLYLEQGGLMKVGWRDRIADWIESVAVGIAERIRPVHAYDAEAFDPWGSPTITFLDAEDLIDNDPMEWEEVLVDDES